MFVMFGELGLLTFVINIYARVVYVCKLSLVYPSLFVGCLCFFCNNHFYDMSRRNCRWWWC